MMKKYLFIASLFVLFSCSNSKSEPVKEINEVVSDSSKLHPHYFFSVLIDINDLQNDNKNNEKYLINHGFYLDDNGTYVDLPNKNIVHIFYEYKSFEGNRIRVPIDSSYTALSNTQLDSIYNLCSKVFIFEDSNLSLDTLPNSSIYDGAYFKVSLRNEMSQTTNTIEFDGTSDSSVGLAYNNLITYIAKIKE